MIVSRRLNYPEHLRKAVNIISAEANCSSNDFIVAATEAAVVTICQSNPRINAMIGLANQVPYARTVDPDKVSA